MYIDIFLDIKKTDDRITNIQNITAHKIKEFVLPIKQKIIYA